MADRYFVESPITTEKAVLSGPEAHHLAHVMRAKAGGSVTVFDGSGRDFLARIERVGRSEVELLIISAEEIHCELPAPIVLGVALPKGDRQRWLVEKAVELGISRLVPCQTARGIAYGTEKKPARLERAVIEASKQCGRSRLMEIGPSQSWDEFVQSAPVTARRYVAHPGGLPLSGMLATVKQGQTPAAFYLGIGPEGGFTDEEVSLAVEAGWQAVDLGPRILRIETAAILFAAMIVLSGSAGASPSRP